MDKYEVYQWESEFPKPNINGIAIHLIPGARGAHLSKNWTVDTNSYVYILFEIQKVT